MYNSLAADHMLQVPRYEDLAPIEKEEHGTIDIPSATKLSFDPAKSLRIDTKGLACLRPRLPSELQMSVYNADGTVAYQSIRTKRSSGNCHLTDAEGHRLVATEYFFGPGRDPVLHLLNTKDNHIKTASGWTSRSHTFKLPDGRTFIWQYQKGIGFGERGAKGTALVLSQGGERLAALIRNEQTRPAGTTRRTAGNGGALVLGSEALEQDGIGEELVVASCLLMLKKEIDRSVLRTQLMIGVIVPN